jgi:hypothetical protein
MLLRPVAGALLALAFALAPCEGSALADDSPAAAPPAAPAPAAPAPAAPAAPPQAQPHGAVVVAVSEGAGPAARALAFDVYRDPDLRPAMDDATARALAGEVPAEDAPARLKELSELRMSILRADSPLVARRLLASLGTELGAALVVAVSMEGTHPVARALRPATAAFERVELGPTAETAPDGVKVYRWPGATATLRDVLLGPAPLAPKAEVAPAAPLPFVGARPFYKSPWFWGAIGGATAIGLSVFAISRATASSSDVHLLGKVGP